MKTSKPLSGFSLIEILLVISTLAILSTSTFIWFAGYQRQTEVSSAAKKIISSLRDAQSRSISGKDFKKWGVLFEDTNNKFILFSDNEGVMEITEEFFLSSFITLESNFTAGCDKIIFEKNKGSTTQDCLIRVSDAGNETSFIEITITSFGLISF